MTPPIFIHDCGIATAIGIGKEAVARNLFAASEEGIRVQGDSGILVGSITAPLSPPPAHLVDIDCRNNRVMQLCLEQIAPTVQRMISRYGKHRIAVILGTSTAGISDGEAAFITYRQSGKWPEGYHYRKQETSNLAFFAARWFGLTGPAYTIATACSSSAKVFASARRLIRAGVVDAAIVGGADTLCQITLQGFASLELLSSTRCNPFSANRNGITIGEGAAAFVLSKEEELIALLGAGETSDAYHPTAPDPEGNGARNAMQQALDDALLTAEDICYINLHGTASLQNDAMESRAVAALFGNKTPCSSTKGLTGHTLGAAGGIEAGFLWLSLHPDWNPGLLPPHLWDGADDPALPPLHFIGKDTPMPSGSKCAMQSNSFGFGGSNVSLILGRGIL